MKSLAGFANYLAMVDPARGAAYQKRIAKLLPKHAAHSEPPPGELNNRRVRASAKKGESARREWWTAGGPPAPVLAKTRQQLIAEKREQKRAMKAESGDGQSSQARAQSRARASGQSPPVDPRIGRFRPKLIEALWLRIPALGLSLAGGSYAWLLVAACWIAVGQAFWRFHWGWRVLLTYVLLMLAGSGLRYLGAGLSF